jgi:hypothetical protein
MTDLLSLLLILTHSIITLVEPIPIWPSIPTALALVLLSAQLYRLIIESITIYLINEFWPGLINFKNFRH